MAVSIFSASALICAEWLCRYHTTIASLEAANREQHGAPPGEDFALLTGAAPGRDAAARTADRDPNGSCQIA